MKNLLVLLIKIYWFFTPPQKRRRCIFRISCSKYVYEKATTGGFIAGVKAFKYRFQNCRSGAHLIENPLTGRLQMILPNHQVLNEQEISKRFIK